MNDEIKDDLYKALNIRLHENKYDKLKEIAKQNGVPVSSMVRNLIYRGIDVVDKTGDPKSFLNSIIQKK